MPPSIKQPPRPWWRSTVLVLLPMLLLLVATACGDDSAEEANVVTAAPPTDASAASDQADDADPADPADEPDDAPTDEADPEVSPAATPEADEAAPAIAPGTVLRIGDQLGSLEIPLRLSGELDDVPYEIEFASFASGPLVNEAFAADAIDIGIMGDTPALLSYAQGLDTVVVGVRASDGIAMTLVARPGSGIETLADIEGRKVAWATGTNQHGFVLRALQSVGLEQGDVEQVDVPLTDVANVLAAEQADVAVLYELFRPPYIDAHPGAIELVTLADFTPSYSYLLALRDTVDDPDKAAAIEDFVARLVRSGVWVDQNEEAWIQAFYVEGQKQTVEYGRQAHEAAGFTEWIAPGDAQQDQQDQADLFYGAGLLPEQVDLSPQFDEDTIGRFTTAILEAQS